MNIKQLLHPKRTLVMNMPMGRKKQIFELIAKLFDETLYGVAFKSILNCLQNREQLSSTNMGNGVAIPHGRITELNAPVACLIKLDNPIKYDDHGYPVDIILGLLAPTCNNEQHIEALSIVAEGLSDSALLNKIKTAKSSESLYNLFVTDPVYTELEI